MALSATALFTRWGLELGGINEANTFSGTTLATRVDNLNAQFVGFANQREVMDGIDQEVYAVQSSLGTWTDDLFTRMQTTIQTMCRDDASRPKTDDLQGWFFKLNQDMTAAGTNILRPAVTSTVSTVGTAIGDGSLICSTTGGVANLNGCVEPIDGAATYYAYSETIRAVCTADSYSGQVTAGSETFSISGETAVDARSVLWPKGSGANTTITAVTPDTAGILTDGELDQWGGTGNNVPTNWTLFGSTAAGTNIFREGTTIYSGNYSAKFTGDAATIIGIYQVLDQSVVVSNSNYAISFWYRSDSASTTGTLRVALVDGNGTAITDNAGTSQADTSVGTTQLAAANGTWTKFTTVLRTPRNLPTELRLEIKFSVALNAHSVYLDRICLSAMTPLYAGGPYHALHSGATAFALSDTFKNVIVNSKSTTNFVRGLDRAFLLAQNGIRLVTTGSPTVSDTLIT